MQGPGLVELVEVPVPSIGSGELLLEMRACGLCGTDLSKIFGGEVSNGPVPLGHELVGVVAAVGKGVRRFAPGDRVAVAHHVPCGRCRHCRHGNEPMCPQFKATNIDPGGFAELVRIPAAQVEQTAFRLPDSVTDEDGVFMEPLACALRAVKRSDVQFGDRIAVVGAGSMGLLVAQSVALRGAFPICLDLREERLEMARAFGIENTVNVAASEPTSALLDLTKRDGIDGAILTAVSGPILQATVGALRDGGRINLFAEAARGSSADGHAERGIPAWASEVHETTGPLFEARWRDEVGWERLGPDVPANRRGCASESSRVPHGCAHDAAARTPPCLLMVWNNRPPHKERGSCRFAHVERCCVPHLCAFCVGATRW